MKRIDELYERRLAKARAFQVLSCGGGLSWHPGSRFWELARRQRKKHDWQTNTKCAWVENTTHIGLRFIGHVVPEFRRGQVFQVGNDICGWFTDPDGYSGHQGDGMAWGAVYQLNTRHGKLRFVPGYFVDDTSNLLVDFSTIYEYPNDFAEADMADMDAVRKAARAADRMAELAAEEEREYREQHREEED
jgi:hypothetical protein